MSGGQTDIVHDRLCKFVIAKQFDISFNRGAAQALIFRVQIQRILRVDVEHVRIGGFLVSPVAELHDEQQASRHQLQTGLPKDMLPTTGQSPVSDRRKNGGKDIKRGVKNRRVIQ